MTNHPSNADDAGVSVNMFRWIVGGVALLVFTLASGWAAHVETRLSYIEDRQNNVRERLMTIEAHQMDAASRLDRIQRQLDGIDATLRANADLLRELKKRQP